MPAAKAKKPPAPPPPAPTQQAVVDATAVAKAASYLGVSRKGLQFCVTSGFTAKQAAQYLGLSTVAIQRAFQKFATLTLGLSATVKLATANISGAEPSSNVNMVWGDAGTSVIACNASGVGSGTHTYATVGTFTVTASQGLRQAIGTVTTT